MPAIPGGYFRQRQVLAAGRSVTYTASLEKRGFILGSALRQPCGKLHNELMLFPATAVRNTWHP